MEMRYDVYVRVDDAGRIISCEGGRTIENVTNNPQFNWVLIDSGSEAKHEFCQTQYFVGGLYSDGGAYRYKLVDGEPVECTPEEIREQEEANKPVVDNTPSQLDILDSRVTYLAMMTDNLYWEV